jgi:predicted nucleotidyltransferase
MHLETLRRNYRDAILSAAARNGVRNVRVFGSVARGDERPDSDIDLLVDLEPGRTLLDHGGFLMDVRDLLDREVDVVTEKGLRKRIRAQVIAEAVPL